MTVSWDEIILTEEYQTDYARCARILADGIAFDALDDEQQVFIGVMAHLLAILRYNIKHLPEQQDIDESQFLSLLQKEVGVEIPYTDAVPVIEFLRENKRWYGGKGTEILYQFVAGLVRSPIEIRYPYDHILRTCDPETRLSGAESNGPLPWSMTKRGFFRDGIYWANYTYVVAVLQAQNVDSMTDLSRLIASIHPAGTKRFLEVTMNIDDEEGATDTEIILGQQHEIETHFHLVYWPTLDNNWILSDRSSKLSQHGGDLWASNVIITEKPLFRLANSEAQVHDDDFGLMHSYVVGRPWAVTRRRIWDPGLEDYREVFADEDALIMDAQTTNCGIGGYAWDDIKDLSWREVAYMAWDKDQQNMEFGVWDYDLLEVQIAET